MSEYVGLDVSLEETAVCVIGAAGEVIAEAKVLSEPEAIAAYVKRRAPRAVKVGLETGSLSPWLHRGLCAAGLPALCIDARRVAAYAQADPVKTDRKDARLIALAMRAGLYRVAHVKSEASLRDRQLLASRQMVLRQARQLQGKVRGDLKPFGVKLGRVGSGGFAGRVKERLADAPELLSAVLPLLDARAVLLEQVRAYDGAVRRIVRADDVCRRLMGVPGVGPLTALCLRATVDDPHRFAKARHVPAAFGLVPRLYQSGEADRYGAISKQGDRLMRCLLFEAANALLTRTRRPSALKRWGLRLAKRRGMNRARVAVARRLAVILFAMWRDGTAFRWQAEPKAA